MLKRNPRTQCVIKERKGCFALLHSLHFKPKQLCPYNIQLKVKHSASVKMKKTFPFHLTHIHKYLWKVFYCYSDKVTKLKHVLA